jgi:hypothetical protein
MRPRRAQNERPQAKKKRRRMSAPVVRRTRRSIAKMQREPAQANCRQVDVQWPAWSDPLDFEEVSVEEAIARVNAAGYFMCNGDIYKSNSDGSVTAQKPSSFNNVFSSRKARCDDGNSKSAGLAWRQSRKRREYDEIGYWPSDVRRISKEKCCPECPRERPGRQRAASRLSQIGLTTSSSTTMPPDIPCRYSQRQTARPCAACLAVMAAWCSGGLE